MMETLAVGIMADISHMLKADYSGPTWDSRYNSSSILSKVCGIRVSSFLTVYRRQVTLRQSFGNTQPQLFPSPLSAL